MANAAAVLNVSPGQGQTNSDAGTNLEQAGIDHELVNQLRRLQHFSAIVLCEDDALRDQVQVLMKQLPESDEAVLSLAEMPEAALPLSLAAQSAGDEATRERAARCLKSLLGKELPGGI